MICQIQVYTGEIKTPWEKEIEQNHTQLNRELDDKSLLTCFC